MLKISSLHWSKLYFSKSFKNVKKNIHNEVYYQK